MTESPTRRPNRHEQKTAQTRAAILDTTKQCLTDLGYAATSIGRIAEQAGFSKGAVQHHFASKEDLIVECAHELLQTTAKSAIAFRVRYVDAEDDGTGKLSRRDHLRRLYMMVSERPESRAMDEIIVASRTNRVLHARIVDEVIAAYRVVDEAILRSPGSLTVKNRLKLQRLMYLNRCFLRGWVIESEFGFDAEQKANLLEMWLDLLFPLLDQLQSSNPRGRVKRKPTARTNNKPKPDG